MRALLRTGPCAVPPTLCGASASCQPFDRTKSGGRRANPDRSRTPCAASRAPSTSCGRPRPARPGRPDRPSASGRPPPRWCRAAEHHEHLVRLGVGDHPRVICQTPRTRRPSADSQTTLPVTSGVPETICSGRGARVRARPRGRVRRSCGSCRDASRGGGGSGADRVWRIRGRARTLRRSCGEARRDVNTAHHAGGGLSAYVALWIVLRGAVERRTARPAAGHVTAPGARARPPPPRRRRCARRRTPPPAGPRAG